MRLAAVREETGSAARSTLELALKNAEQARDQALPICQDTGTNIYWVRCPREQSTAELTLLIQEATRQAVQEGLLRPNAVDPITGKNSGDNVGPGQPCIHFEESNNDFTIELLLKGGGCENSSYQYSLPDTELKAGRDLDGVYRVVLDSVFRAQGRGCAPGILGIGIGGDRMTSWACAKEQLMRPLEDTAKHPELASLEQKIYTDANKLGIGPMGYGGKSTLLGVKTGACHRLPASYFVSIAYMCWACRRSVLHMGPDGSPSWDDARRGEVE